MEGKKNDSVQEVGVNSRSTLLLPLRSKSKYWAWKKFKFHNRSAAIEDKERVR